MIKIFIYTYIILILSVYIVNANIKTEDTFLLTNENNLVVGTDTMAPQEKIIKNSYIIELYEMPLSIKKETRQMELLENEHRKVKEMIKTVLKKEIIDRTPDKIVGRGLERATGQFILKHEYFHAYNGLAVEMDLDDAEKLRQLPEIKAIHEDKIVNAMLRESIPIIKADKVWIQTDNSGNSITGRGITIGIIDTGVDYTHVALGSCSITDNINDGFCAKVIGGYDYYNSDSNPMDDNGHGTHVASTAAGQFDGYSSGVAPDAKVYAYKVLGSAGSGSLTNVIAAINAGVIARLNILSMSLGYQGGTPDDPDAVAVDNAVKAGVVVVISAGNSGPNYETIGCPGCARTAITVAASDKSDRIASFSSRGPVVWSGGTLDKPDVAAPGVGICAALWDNAYPSICFDNKHAAISGTSMAAPHVAGAAALILQANPQYKPDAVKLALMNSAVNLGYDKWTQGAGRIDVLAALGQQIKAITNPTTISFLVTPTTKIIPLRSSFTIENIATSTLNFAISASTQPGLSIVPDITSISVQPGSISGKIDLTITVDTDLLQSGKVSSAYILLVDSGNIVTLKLPVSISLKDKISTNLSIISIWNDNFKVQQNVETVNLGITNVRTDISQNILASVNCCTAKTIDGTPLSSFSAPPIILGSSNLNIAPAGTSNLPISVIFDNAVNEEAIYYGNLILESTLPSNDVKSVPFEIYRIKHFSIRFSDYPTDLIIINRDTLKHRYYLHSGTYRLPNTYPFTFNVPLPTGTYDIIGVTYWHAVISGTSISYFENIAPRIVVKEGLVNDGFSEVPIDFSEADNPVNAITYDENNNVVTSAALGGGQLTLTSNPTYVDSTGDIWFLTLFSLPSTFYINDISSRYMMTMNINHFGAKNKNLYTMGVRHDSGISGPIEISNKNLKKYKIDLRYHPNGSITSTLHQSSSDRKMGVTGLGNIEPLSLQYIWPRKNLTKDLRDTIYASFSSPRADIRNALELNVHTPQDTFFFWGTTAGSSIGLSSNNILTRYYLSEPTAEDRVESMVYLDNGIYDLGIGPHIWVGKFSKNRENQQYTNITAYGPNPFVILGQNLDQWERWGGCGTCDTVPYEVYKNNVLKYNGFLHGGHWRGGLALDDYRGIKRFIDTGETNFRIYVTYFINGTKYNSTVNAVFDAAHSDPSPPYFNFIQVYNGDHLTDTLKPGLNKVVASINPDGGRLTNVKFYQNGKVLPVSLINGLHSATIEAIQGINTLAVYAEDESSNSIRYDFEIPSKFVVSSIKNKQASSLTDRLTVKLQKLNANGVWQDYMIIFNDHQYPIAGNSELSLANIINNANIAINEFGRYRILADFGGKLDTTNIITVSCNTDNDKDGWLSSSCGGLDCNDNNGLINPSREDECNDGIDNNCDGSIDYLDADKDGYNSCNYDCRDDNAGVNPSVVETVCLNDIDEDCSGRDCIPYNNDVKFNYLAIDFPGQPTTDILKMTEIDANAPDSNFNDYHIYRTIGINIARRGSTDGYNTYLLIGFPNIIGTGTKQIPLGAQIKSAKLNLYHVITGGSIPTSDPALYRVLKPWHEGLVTWNKYDGINPWGRSGANLAGVDYISSPDYASFGSSYNSRLTIDVTKPIQSWANGHPNYGWIFKHPQGVLPGTVEFINDRERIPLFGLHAPFLNVTFSMPSSCTDLDGDGFGPGCQLGNDCNDNNAGINTNANEVCDSIDNDCDMHIDEDFCGPTTITSTVLTTTSTSSLTTSSTTTTTSITSSSSTSTTSISTSTTTSSSTSTSTTSSTSTSTTSTSTTTIPGASIATFRQGENGYSGSLDTYIDQFLLSNSFGTNAWLAIRQSSNNFDQVALIWFDIPSIPDTATINSATLMLTTSNSGVQDGQIGLYRLLTSGWSAGATWNKKDGIASWAAGSFSTADYNTNALVTVSSPSTIDTRFNITSSDLASYVQQGLAGNRVQFAIIHSTDGFSEYVYSNEVELRYRPKLFISYTS